MAKKSVPETPADELANIIADAIRNEYKTGAIDQGESVPGELRHRVAESHPELAELQTWREHLKVALEKLKSEGLSFLIRAGRGATKTQEDSSDKEPTVKDLMAVSDHLSENELALEEFRTQVDEIAGLARKVGGLELLRRCLEAMDKFSKTLLRK